jgi:hypothetical protein
MHGRVVAIGFLLLASVAKPVIAADRMQFWNLTSTRIAKLYLAPAGTTNWSPDQCANDPDGTVDHDERLKLVGISAGRYDVRLVDAKGGACLIKDVMLQSGKPYAFSLEDADLKDCKK